MDKDEKKKLVPHYKYDRDTREVLIAQLGLRDTELKELKGVIKRQENELKWEKKKYDEYIETHSDEQTKLVKLDRVICDMLAENQKLQVTVNVLYDTIEDLGKQLRNSQDENHLLKEQVLAQSIGLDSGGSVIILEKLKELEEEIKEIKVGLNGQK